MAPAGIEAARIDAHARPVATASQRRGPKWMNRAVLAGSAAAAAALALVVGTSVWLYLDNGRSQQYAGNLGQAQLEVARGRTAVLVSAPS